MKKPQGYDTAQAFTGEFETLAPGGYVCVIKKVIEEEKSYGTLLRIAFDIAEGEHKDFYKRRFEEAKKANPDAKWQGMYYQTARDDNPSYFKGFVTAIESSNPGYKCYVGDDFDTSTLKGKLFGGLFGQEEYEGNDGSIKLSTKCRFIRSVEQVRKGVKAPDVKRLQQTASSVFPSGFAGDDEIPF